ncbi:hypothetical protein H9P43_003764 [Blastocladiella emersonii ATCC 22665]|nr:hypothetical protein H9P43_003764 [Blastocladiella emersonii ATCC 22665]
MAAFIASTVLTSIAFFLLGAFRLGNVMGFFPRHILVGSIGGVGYFLLQTAIEVSAHVKVEYTHEALTDMFQATAFAQWGISLAVALVLRLALTFHLDRKLLGADPRRRGMFVPCFFLVVPIFFHVALYLMQVDVEAARELGWLFELPEDKPFYNFYRHVRPGDVVWSILPSLLPTMLSLTFFSVLHVPINVPALAVSTRSGVSVNRELANHGLANLLSAMCGSVQSYLVYSTSVMLHRSGGDSRWAGYTLTVLTFLVWVFGGSLMRLVPTIVVGSLMFHLGIDLAKEAVWDTRGLVTPLEYSTIWLIIGSMAALGFTEGVGVGLILACIFFVATYASRTHDAVIARERRGTLWGTPVRRMPAHRAILREPMRHAVHVLELHGFVFFGSVHHITKRVQNLIDPGRSVGAAAELAKARRRRIVWPEYTDPATSAVVATTPGSAADLHRPQFLVLDFAHCQDIDFSAGEAFVKLQRLLAAHHVGLVLAGVGGDGRGHIARALQRAGVWPTHRAVPGDRSGIVCCATLSGALEYCENAVLAGVALPPPPHAVVALATRNVDAERVVLAAMVLGTAGNDDAELRLDAQLFAATTADGKPLFERRELAPGTILWRAGDDADSVALVLRGALCEARVAPSPALLGARSRDSLVLLGSVAAAAAVAAASEHTEALVAAAGEDPDEDDPAARWMTSLPGTAVGVRAFVTRTARRTACWVAPLGHFHSSSAAPGESSSSSEGDEDEQQLAMTTVVYLVRRATLEGMDPVDALRLVRLLVRADEQ